MAKKILTSTELLEKHTELSAAADAALNNVIPQNPALERRVALLIGRSAAFFTGSRPPSEQGRWVIALHRKIYLLRELEAHAAEITKLKASVK